MLLEAWYLLPLLFLREMLESGLVTLLAVDVKSVDTFIDVV